MQVHYKVVLIAAVNNSVFASLSLCYVKYLNLLFNFTVFEFCRVDSWILMFCYLDY